MADPAVREPAAEATALGRGDMVRSRRALWRVDTLRHEAHVTFLELQPAADSARAARTLVAPFDRIDRFHADPRLAPVSRRRAAHRLTDLAVASSPFDMPVSAAGASVRLLAFQLEPLLALRAGIAARLLIADHVGLGKTIQAALIARDLVATRGRAAILILTPAGIREQWRAELEARVGLHAWLADAGTLRARAAALPGHVNPWAAAARASVIVSSIDFVKQPDVRHGLSPLTWDLLIVDEAHALTPGSDRLAAAEALARQSDRLVLLTATPHDGRESGFQALCDLGRVASSDVLAVFRRTRAISGATHRRVTRRLAIRPSAAERRVQALLERYANRVWRAGPDGAGRAARLAMTVLFKRAASSAASLAQSLERRRALVGSDVTGTPVQAALPIAEFSNTTADSEDSAPDSLLAAPGLDLARERTWLNLLVHAAHAAAADESKVRALIRLIRRIREPIIVFTEYRDTLMRLEPLLRRIAPIVTIHGGRPDDARHDALRTFESGAARVLLATDAASVGLNLQAHCRIVVQVDLPWSPTRLEQRVGRVDRLGQTRTVHALHLVAEGSVEAHIEERLAERVRRVREALERGVDEDRSVDDGVDPVECLESALAAEAKAEDPLVERAPERPGVVWPRLRDEANRATAWLERLRRLHERNAGTAPRRLIAAGTEGARRQRRRRGPFVARLRRSRAHHGALPPGRLFVYRTRIAWDTGTLVEHTLTTIVVARGVGNSGSGTVSPGVRRMVDAHAARLVDARCVVLSETMDRTEALVRVRRREAAARADARPSRVQLVLFDELMPDDDLEDPEPLIRTAPPPVRLHGTAHLVAVLIVD